MGKASRKKKPSADKTKSDPGRQTEVLSPSPDLPAKGRLQNAKNSAVSHLMLGVIFIVTFAVYFNTFYNGFVVDDMKQVIENPWIRDVRFLPDIFSKNVWAFAGDSTSNYYRPLMHVIYMINYHVFGLKPWGFHLVNTLFHAGNASLLFIIMTTLVTRYNPRALERQTGLTFMAAPFIAAILFATHPINTEAVAWIAAITELSYTFFYLLSLYFYIKSNGNIKNYSYILSVAAFSTALLCKEPAVTLPVVLFAYDVIFRDASKHLFSYAKKYTPYLVIIGIYFIVRMAVLGSLVPIRMPGDVTTNHAIINAFFFFVLYLWKLILPLSLNEFWTIDPIKSLFEIRGILIVIVTVAYVILAVVAYRKKKPTFFALVIITLPILPALYIPARGGPPLCERYLYLPSAGFTGLVAMSFVWLREKLPRYGFALITVIVVLTGLYSLQTITRNRVWKDNFTILPDSIKKSPNAEWLRGSFGEVLLNAGMVDEAIEQFKAITARINPNSEGAYYHLGLALKEKGQLREAITAFEKTISLNPNHADARHYLAVVYAKSGMTDKAVKEYIIFMRLKPNTPETYSVIGVDLAKEGLDDKAIELFKKALTIDKDYFAAHYNLGSLYMKAGQIDEAIEHFNETVRLQPDNPQFRNMLGGAYIQKGLYDKAIEQFKAAVKLAPNEPIYQENLDGALRSKGAGTRPGHA